jgi:hypothetical protein
MIANLRRHLAKKEEKNSSSVFVSSFSLHAAFLLWPAAVVRRGADVLDPDHLHPRILEPSQRRLLAVSRSFDFGGDDVELARQALLADLLPAQLRGVRRGAARPLEALRAPRRPRCSGTSCKQL